MLKLKIGILGVGNIGKVIALRLAAAGHDVTVANSGDPKGIPQNVLATGARAGLAADVIKDIDVLILSIPLNKMPKLKPLISLLPVETVVIDTSNYYPGRDGHINALDHGQAESEWIQEQIGHPIAKAWNMILSESFQKKNHPPGHPDRLAIAISADKKHYYEMAAELVEITGFDAYNAGPISDSWRLQPAAPAYCTEATLRELPGLLMSAEKSRLPLRRDFAMDVIAERLSDGKSQLPEGFIAQLNRVLYI